jgi:hypothetical protein
MCGLGPGYRCYTRRMIYGTSRRPDLERVSRLRCYWSMIYGTPVPTTRPRGAVLATARGSPTPRAPSQRTALSGDERSPNTS